MSVFVRTGRLLNSPAAEREAEMQEKFDLVRPGASVPAVPQLIDGDASISGKPVEFEVRYTSPDAESVYILWALDGWQPPDKSYWPAGSAAKKGYPYCEMKRDRGEFAITLTVPEGAILDYCFNILAPSRGMNIWDTNGAVHRDYHSRIARNGSAFILAERSIAPAEEEPWTSRMLSQPAAFILPATLAVLLAVGVLRLRRGRAHVP